MEGNDIILSDIERILMGGRPLMFLIEAVIRIIFLYIMLAVSVRLLGGRKFFKPDKDNLAGLVIIAASAGLPSQDPGRGLLPAFLAAVIVVLTIMRLNRMAAKKGTGKRPDILVSDGVIDLGVLKRTGITHQNVLSLIRSEGIDNLGRIKRLYFEKDGSFSLTLREGTNPGLSVIPEWDTAYRNSQPDEKDMRACTRCGYTARTSETYSGCPRCSSITWETAVV